MTRLRDSARRNSLIAAGLVTAGALGAYAYKIETNWLELTTPTIPLPRLPAALDGLKLLLLTDPHVSRWGIRESRTRDMVETLTPPDAILWGGDFIQGSGGIPDALVLVREVAARHPGVPTYGVLGNAEHKLPWQERLRFIDQLTEAGITMLLNRHQHVTLRGTTFILAGVDDPYYGHADLEVALAGAPVSDTFTLLLAHSPQIATQAARAGIDLMLSGHTHGGQIRLPFLGPLKTQNPLSFRLDCGLFPPDRLARTLGFDPGGNLTTYISRGIGIALVPILGWPAPRFLCRPEVALLTLRALPRLSTE